MNINTLDYSIKLMSLDIYISGCKGPYCEGCHNPQLWDFKQGKNWVEWKVSIFEYLDNYNDLIENIMLFGGEPLDQTISELVSFINWLRFFDKKVWLFTGKESIDNVPKSILKLVDYVKIGRYEKNKKPGKSMYGIELATNNQYIYRRGLNEKIWT